MVVIFHFCSSDTLSPLSKYCQSKMFYQSTKKCSEQFHEILEIDHEIKTVLQQKISTFLDQTKSVIVSKKKEFLRFKIHSFL